MEPEERGLTPSTRSYRRTRVRIVWWLLAAVWFLLGLVEMGVAYETPGTIRWFPFVLGVWVCIPSAMVLVRVFGIGIFADERGVLFKNFVSSYRHVWCDIDRFELPRPYGAVRKAGLAMVLRDGRRQTSSLYVRGMFDFGDDASRVVEELQDGVVRHRATCVVCGPGRRQT